MDAREAARKQEMERLTARLAELMVEQQRAEGVFETTPHFSVLEEAGHAMGQRVSRAIQEQSVRETVAQSMATGSCPTCHLECPLEQKQRTLQGREGPVEVLETCGYCRRCRRSFFPSTHGDGIR